MIRTVYIDDKNVNVGKQLNKAQHRRLNANREYINTSKIVPEGYMSCEEFWKEADKRIVEVCKQYGIL